MQALTYLVTYHHKVGKQLIKEALPALSVLFQVQLLLQLDWELAQLPLPRLEMPLTQLQAMSAGVLQLARSL